MPLKKPEHALFDQSIYFLHFPDGKILAAARMPFVSPCGLFIPSRASHRLGDQVVLFLRLLSDTERYGVGATVVWVGQGSFRKGIGVRFNNTEHSAVKRLVKRLEKIRIPARSLTM